MQDLDLLLDQFPGVSIPSYFSLASNAHFIQIIFNLTQPPLFGFPVDPFPFVIFLNTFFTVLSSGIITTCPNCHNFPLLISEIISGSLCRSINSWLVQILHTPFSFTWPNIFVNIFLSHYAKVYSLLLLSVQTSNHTLLPF